jgi:D-ribose pyranase
MLKTGILHPQINALLARVRHTNTLVIADRGFPSWPGVETIDIALVDDVPTVLQVLAAVRANFVVGMAWMAEEFAAANDGAKRDAFAVALAGVAMAYEPHEQLKCRVTSALGIIRTGDTTQYGNVVLESA